MRTQQDIYQNKMQARSRIAAAVEIANAINMRNNNNFSKLSKNDLCLTKIYYLIIYRWFIHHYIIDIIMLYFTFK